MGAVWGAFASVDTPLAEVEARDTKGPNAKARAREMASFTGIDSPDEAPLAPTCIDTKIMSADAAADAVIAALPRR